MRRLPVVPPLDLPGRREVLRWIGVGTALAALPVGCTPKASSPPAEPPLRFLTAPEARALGALADAVLPPDEEAGGKALGTVVFVDRLLSAFDTDGTPQLLAGGPYSGRQPFAAQDGTPSRDFPQNDFRTFLALDRVSERAWRLYLYGSDAVGGGPNDALLGKTVGLRDQVRAGLAAAIAQSPAPLETLDADALALALRALDPAFRDVLVALVSQAAFSAPEYGGNVGGAGWRLVHYEGDSLPLGYSQWDAVHEVLRERPEAPLSTANPGADPAPLDDETRQFVTDIVTLLGGKEFGR